MSASTAEIHTLYTLQTRDRGLVPYRLTGGSQACAVVKQNTNTTQLMITKKK